MKKIRNINIEEKTVSKVITTSLFLLVLSVIGVYAHGGMTHVMGTITAVNDNHLTVKTTDGKSVSVMLNSDTKYLRENGAASAADMKVGARVMADATMDKKMNMLVAKEVRLSPAKTTSDKEKETGRSNASKK